MYIFCTLYFVVIFLYIQISLLEIQCKSNEKTTTTTNNQNSIVLNKEKKTFAILSVLSAKTIVQFVYFMRIQDKRY